MTGTSEHPARIRSWQREDAAVCRALYLEGLTGSAADLADTGIDIDDIEAAYMKDSASHFWVAVNNEGEVVGIVGVQRHEQGAGEIRRLRVRADSRRRGVGSQLLETAIQFCHENGHLKITLDTFGDRAPAIKLFEKFNFRHNRTRTIHNKDFLYFYLDIYGQGGQGQNRSAT